MRPEVASASALLSEMPQVSSEIAEQAVRLLIEWQNAREDQSAWQAIADWRSEHPEHERAWRRIEDVNQHFQRLADSPGMVPTHVALEKAAISRRYFLKGLSVVVLASGAGLLASQHRPWERWLADHYTSVGERKTLVLGNGTELTLNSDSVVRLHATPRYQWVELLRGEVFIRSGSDQPNPGQAHANVQLRVLTREGHITPLGTRFAVRQMAKLSQVDVYAGQVSVQPDQAEQATAVHSGESLSYTSKGVVDLAAVAETDMAWVYGMIVGAGMSLQRFVEQLGRHHPGIIQCAPQIRHLRVAGTFPVSQLDVVLRGLAVALPIRVQRFTDLWVRLLPAE